MCDLDRFKAVNDTFGHPVGDELLRQATRRMRAQIRADNIMARLGGDEFAIIYLSRNDFEGAEGLARRLVACLEQPFEIQGHEVSIGISIGIAIATVHATSADELMIRADLALYAAKQGGRSMHRVYEPAMSMFANKYGGLEAALRKAIDNESLHLLYQPQVDLRTRRIVGFEALARWDLAERGPCRPISSFRLPKRSASSCLLAHGCCVEPAMMRSDGAMTLWLRLTSPHSSSEPRDLSIWLPTYWQSLD